MGKFYDHLPDNLRDWARTQKLFWVASAPLSKDGHVNLSPKGYGQSYMLIDNHKIVYEDLTGSGVETISHMRENGRITLLFHSFDGPPRLCRVFGTGSYHEYGSPEYEAHITPEKRSPGSRAIIVIDIHKVGTSCGYGIPLYEYKAERPTLHNWSAILEKPDARPGTSMFEWWQAENTHSIDGLPALEALFDKSGTKLKHNWVKPPPQIKKKKDAAAAPEAAPTKKVNGSAALPAGQAVAVKGPLGIDDKMFNGFVVGVSFAALLFYASKALGIPLF